MCFWKLNFWKICATYLVRFHWPIMCNRRSRAWSSLSPRWWRPRAILAIGSRWDGTRAFPFSLALGQLDFDAFSTADFLFFLELVNGVWRRNFKYLKIYFIDFLSQVPIELNSHFKINNLLHRAFDETQYRRNRADSAPRKLTWFVRTLQTLPPDHSLQAARRPAFPRRPCS